MAVEIDKDWRKKEESYWEIKKKYPTVSPFVITQIDVQRRGVEYTDAALDKVDPAIHQTGIAAFAGWNQYHNAFCFFDRKADKKQQGAISGGCGG